MTYEPVDYWTERYRSQGETYVAREKPRGIDLFYRAGFSSIAGRPGPDATWNGRWIKLFRRSR